MSLQELTHKELSPPNDKEIVMYEFQNEAQDFLKITAKE